MAESGKDIFSRVERLIDAVSRLRGAGFDLHWSNEDAQKKLSRGDRPSESDFERVRCGKAFDSDVPSLAWPRSLGLLEQQLTRWWEAWKEADAALADLPKDLVDDDETPAIERWSARQKRSLISIAEWFWTRGSARSFIENAVEPKNWEEQLNELDNACTRDLVGVLTALGDVPLYKRINNCLKEISHICQSLGHDLASGQLSWIGWTTLWSSSDRTRELLDAVPPADLLGMTQLSDGTPWSLAVRQVLDAIAQPVLSIRGWSDELARNPPQEERRRVFAALKEAVSKLTPTDLSTWPALVVELDRLRLRLQSIRSRRSPAPTDDRQASGAAYGRTTPGDTAPDLQAKATAGGSPVPTPAATPKAGPAEGLNMSRLAALSDLAINHAEMLRDIIYDLDLPIDVMVHGLTSGEIMRMPGCTLMRPGFFETGSARLCEMAGANNIPQSINGDGVGRGRGGTSVSRCLSP
ncbi:MAG: hypothetical protein NTY19_03175, partial [Planctomycetota bacterium]|nr:hypothetical protein [Planctomycetota bacterium]